MIVGACSSDSNGAGGNMVGLDEIDGKWEAGDVKTLVDGNFTEAHGMEVPIPADENQIELVVYTPQSYLSRLSEKSRQGDIKAEVIYPRWVWDELHQSCHPADKDSPYIEVDGRKYYKGVIRVTASDSSQPRSIQFEAIAAISYRCATITVRK